MLCSTAVSTAARRSSGRRSSRTSPESSFESSSRFWASQSSRSICWPLDSRNSARASGSSAAPSLSSSLNVRRAASGVRSSCETSARKSRLRSRSRRMISTLSWSRSAIALNWTASSAISDDPARTSSGGTRRVRSPSASPRDASVRRRSGVVKRRAMAADTSTLSPSANSATAASRPVTLASAVARKVYGLDSVTWTAYGLNEVARRRSVCGPGRSSPASGRPAASASRLIWIGPPFAGTNGLVLAAGHVLPERELRRRPGRAGRR